jgi:hypothetical protein
MCGCSGRAEKPYTEADRQAGIASLDAQRTRSRDVEPEPVEETSSESLLYIPEDFEIPVPALTRV